MPEQFPYPEVGWSTGKMRKKKSFLSGEADVGEAARNFEASPLVDSIAKQHQERMKAQGIPEQMKAVLPRSGVGASEVRELEGLRKEKTQHLSQAKPEPKEMSEKDYTDWLGSQRQIMNFLPNRKLDNAIQQFPNGFLIDKNHPELKDIEGDVDLFTVPGQGGKDKYLAKPKTTEEGMV